jgi:hypothetical protein
MTRALLECLFTRNAMWGAKFALCQSFRAKDGPAGRLVAGGEGRERR